MSVVRHPGRGSGAVLHVGVQNSQCGWLKDRYGVSWQIVPRQVFDYIFGPDARRADAAMKAMMQMSKLDVAELHRAYDKA